MEERKPRRSYQLNTLEYMNKEQLKEEFMSIRDEAFYNDTTYGVDKKAIADWWLSHTISKEEVVRVVGGQIESTDKKYDIYSEQRRLTINQERQRILSELNLIEK